MSANARFQRTTGVLEPRLLERLRAIHVLIAGVGGSGGQTAVDLARMGVETFTLADFDVYERHNMNRQIGCFESTLGQLKIEVVGKMIQDINPNARIRYVREGVTLSNIEDLLSPKDFLAPDFVIELIDIKGLDAKISLHHACRKKQVIAMTAIMLGLGAALISFGPETPSYEDLFIVNGHIDLDSIVPGFGSYMDAQALRDCTVGKSHVPTCVIGATLASGLLVSEMIRVLKSGQQSLRVYPEFTSIDFLDQKLRLGRFRTREKASGASQAHV